VLLKRAALYLGNWIWGRIENETKEKVKNKNLDLIEIQNRLKIILLYIAVTLTLLAFGWITGLWIKLGLSFISFAIIRWWNGGHHFSVDACYFVTIGVILGVIPLSYIIQEYQTIALIAAVTLNIVYAPFYKVTKNYYTKKITSIILCILSFYINEIFLTMWLVLGFDLIRVKRTVD
jgi:accessory gene regulator protein AgrB